MPLHPNCHCYTKDIGQIDASASCKEDKIQYAFTFREKDDKSGIFTNLGYSIKDREFLRKEFINQGKQQYECGEYELRELKIYGQTIRIVVTLQDRMTGETVSFYTGWMVEPNGNVRLTTPFCGWVNKRSK